MIQSIFLSLNDLQKTPQPGYCIYLPYEAYKRSRYFQKILLCFFLNNVTVLKKEDFI